MLQLRCTAKAQKQLGIKPSQLSAIKESVSTLGNWYVNLMTIDRRKTFLFMSENTLLSFIIYGVKKSNSPNIHEIFIRGLSQLLLFESFSDKIVNMINDEYFEIEFTKTNSRSTLGNMNELMDHYKYHIHFEGGLQHCDLTNIIRRVNRMPQRNIGWKYSIDAVKELLIK